MDQNETNKYLKKLYLPQKSSHKGQNGRLLIIGGSKLFHSASIWSLKVASRIVDLVHYASTEENNNIVQKLKEEFRDGIVVSRLDIEDYIKEDGCVLIGPGMMRVESSKLKDQRSKINLKIHKLKEIIEFDDEGLQTYYLTKYLLQKYPDKKWVIDAGSLQMLEPEWIPEGAILTPHHQEFELLKLKIKNEKLKTAMQNAKFTDQVKLFAKEFHCIVLLKGEADLIASVREFIKVDGGNAGMTKGGTGDVLAGLVAGLFTQNEGFISAVCASYLNKKAGEDLYEKKGYWFNASDLADQIPETMKEILL